METDDSELTPNSNYLQLYSHMNQGVLKKMDRSTYKMFKTPYECGSGDSGFHSMTPSSVELEQNSSDPVQYYSTDGMVTPEVSVNINFRPHILPVNSTPVINMDMMETSLYTEDEEMKDQFILLETEQFNINDTDNRNVFVSKHEESTNISSLYKDLKTSYADSNEKKVTNLYDNLNCSNVNGNGSEQNKANDDNLSQSIFTTPSVLISPENEVCVTEVIINKSDEVAAKMVVNRTNFKHVPQQKNLLPLVSPFECLSKKRFLNGIEHLDIMYLLGEKENFQNIIMKIVSYLSPHDLMNVKNVSPTWNRIFSNISPVQKKWREIKKQYKEQKENVSNGKESSGELKSSRRRGRQTFLTTIENTNSTHLQPPKCSAQLSPNVSPSKRRFHLFHKEGQKLKQGERLLRCPKCSFPSRDLGSTYATCTRAGCKFEFCIFCCGAYSSNHNCPPLYTPRPCRRTIIIGSKGSKRNLRRL